MNEFRGKPNN